MGWRAVTCFATQALSRALVSGLQWFTTLDSMTCCRASLVHNMKRQAATSLVTRAGCSFLIPKNRFTQVCLGNPTHTPGPRCSWSWSQEEDFVGLSPALIQIGSSSLLEENQEQKDSATGPWETFFRSLAILCLFPGVQLKKSCWYDLWRIRWCRPRKNGRALPCVAISSFSNKLHHMPLVHVTKQPRSARTSLGSSARPCVGMCGDWSG